MFESFLGQSELARFRGSPAWGEAGQGVTATSLDEAKSLLLQRLSVTNEQAALFEFSEVSSLTMLDAKHVLPNMGNHHKRGIWFPLGYE